ncbi:MAG TPA: hypothetical protein VF981_03935 [Gemmatimonadaceae bacterium]
MGHPDLSVVLVTDHFRTIRRVVDALRGQTICDRIETVIVTSSAQQLDLDVEATRGLGAVRVVEFGRIAPMPPARAAGVRAATAPLIFLGETHSYAHPDFASAILAAHTGHWDVVVPGLDNANPDGALSWAGFLADYGAWHRDLPAGQVSAGPTWNVAYKREALLSLGDDLERALSAGDEVCRAFRKAGRTWYFEPRAPLDHANVSRPRPWAHERYLAGMMIAASRNTRWTRSRRLAYALASPLIALVVLSRMIRPMTGVRRRLPRGTFVALVAGVILRTAGEAVGYIRGASRRDQAHMDDYELHKLKYVRHA